MVLALLPSSLTNFTLLSEEHSGGNGLNQTVYIVYGHPAPLSLLPCASASNLTSSVHCAAAAVQLIANGTVAEASPQILVEDVSVNVTAR